MRLGVEISRHTALNLAVQTNTPAVELYRSSGFEITRELQCWTYAAPAPPLRADIVLEVSRELPDWNAAATFRDVRTSWQNSDAALARAAA